MKKHVQCIFLFFVSIVIASSSWSKLPYHPITFPRDDAAHNANVPYPVGNMTEWWYYNGRLTTKEGRKIGYYMNYMYIQLVIGKEKLMIPVFMIQVADPDQKKVYGRTIFTPVSRFSSQDVDISIGHDVTLKRVGKTFLLEGKIKDDRDRPMLQFSIKATPTREPLFINETGLIDMFHDTNSYYYSYTRLDAEGYIQIGDDKIQLNRQENRMWMDHQWGDFVIQPGEDQWFFSLIQLEDGSDILATVPYDSKTKQYIGELGFANMITPDNKRFYLKNPRLFVKEIPGEKNPQYYELTLPDMDLKLSLTSWIKDQNLNWISESASSVEGTFRGQPVKGTANIESTVQY